MEEQTDKATRAVGTRGGVARVRCQKGETGGKAGPGDSHRVPASLAHQVKESWTSRW